MKIESFTKFCEEYHKNQNIQWSFSLFSGFQYSINNMVSYLKYEEIEMEAYRWFLRKVEISNMTTGLMESLDASDIKIGNIHEFLSIKLSPLNKQLDCYYDRLHHIICT